MSVTLTASTSITAKQFLSVADSGKPKHSLLYEATLGSTEPPSAAEINILIKVCNIYYVNQFPVINIIHYNYV